jgi:hypothetical protein
LPADSFGGNIPPCGNVITGRKVGHGFLVWTRIVYGVDDLHAIERREEGRAAELALPLREALEGELRRLGVELFAVMELHAFAELDLPRRGRDELRHLDREARHDLEILVALVERVHDVPPDVRRRTLGLVGHVERRRIDALRDDDLAGRRRARRDRQQQDDDREQDFPRDHSSLLRSLPSERLKFFKVPLL